MDYTLEYDPSELWQQSSPFVQAASWHIAEKLVRGCDETYLWYSDTPEGVGYDTLHVGIRQSGKDCSVWINRGGSIHMHGSVRYGNLASPGVWQAFLSVEGRERVMRDIYSSLEISVPGGKPSTPISLMCRVMSQALLDVCFSRNRWSSFAKLPTNPDASKGIRSDEDLSKVLIWVLANGEEQVAKFKDGWMFLASGDRIDLYSHYRAGESIQSLAARIHNQKGAGRAVPPDAHFTWSRS